MTAKPPESDTPQSDGDEPDELERDEQRRRERGLDPLDPDAPGAWILDPEGDAPEPSEPG